MDSSKLKSISKGVRKEKSSLNPPLNPTEVSSAILHFTSVTGQWMNEFVATIDHKMNIISNKIDDMEIQMELLEDKLSSLDSLPSKIIDESEN